MCRQRRDVSVSFKMGSDVVAFEGKGEFNI